MKWRGRRGSRNIVDRRRSGGRAAAGGIGGLGLIIVLVLGLFFGVDVTPLLQGGYSEPERREVSAQDDAMAQFVSVTLADTEEVWADIFRNQLGRTYDPPQLVLFSGTTQSPCGGASTATGPFYCPADERAYLDTDFFMVLDRQLGAGGDFAAAYVIAHEVAHHVQQELGILGQANAARQAAGQRRSNEISVRIELQADCLSGIWARAAQARFGSLEPGDLQEAINAAKEIGDDELQREAGRVVRPHTFTHGSSEQRQRWFIRGYESGDLQACDTFGTNRL
ncbi:neutral zinc metallopeptidase [Aestuariibius sp. 2305UL40-4]|uniref:KPN_02809 family neutral zinc metallopeptidase n=1 Tax=Aestuariibius violaceus TaxID=3234132 RepID=UPI00345F11ED